MSNLKSNDIWHETATVKIKYEPDQENPYNDPEVIKIYNKIKKEDENERNNNKSKY